MAPSDLFLKNYSTGRVQLCNL